MFTFLYGLDEKQKLYYHMSCRATKRKNEKNKDDKNWKKLKPSFSSKNSKDFEDIEKELAYVSFGTALLFFEEFAWICDRILCLVLGTIDLRKVSWA